MNESILIAAVLVVLVAAVTFYFVSRMSYLEKKVGLLENVLIDIKMGLESMEQEDHEAPAAAATHEQPLPAAAVFAAPRSGAPVAETGLEVEVDEKFYSSVLAEAAGTSSGLSSMDAVNETEIIQEEPAPTANTQPSSRAATTEPNYDSMTRSELVALAEQRGLRVPKRLGRGEVIGLLRKSESSRNETPSTGTDNASAPSGALGGSLVAGTASMGSEFTVDLGQSDVAAGGIEETTL